MNELDTMFDPKTIALIGATGREGSVGRSILDNLMACSGKKIFAVNRRGSPVGAFPSYREISALPERVDLAIIATPAVTLPELVAECGGAGVRGVVVVSDGSGTAPADWKQIKNDISETGKRYGLRILGPNSPGIIRPHTGLFASAARMNPKPGSTAFISQSSSIGSAIVDWGISNHIGFSMFVSLGSMIDIDFADVIDFLQEDYATRSIMIYMERVADARRFASASRCFARNKPIVVLKPGRYPAVGDTLRIHTGADVGDDRVYDAAFMRLGAVRVKTIEDLFDTARVLVSKSIPRGPKLAIVTNSGGAGILAGDALVEPGGELALFTEKTRAALGSLIPGAAVSNPLDIHGDAGEDRYRQAISLCLEDPRVDGVLVIYVPILKSTHTAIAATVVELARKNAKPILTVFLGGDSARDGEEILERNGMPVYNTPEEAVNAYFSMYRYRRNIDLLEETPEDLLDGQVRLTNYLKAIIHNTIKSGERAIDMEATMGLLKNYGLSSVPTMVVHGFDEARRFAERNGYPLVVKAEGTTITDIASDEQLKDAYHAITGTSGSNTRGPLSKPVLVQKMLKGFDVEWMLTSYRDIEFGAVIFFSRKSDMAGNEVFLSAALPPLNSTLARKLLEDADPEKFRKTENPDQVMLLRSLEAILIGFSNIVVDLPELERIDAGPIVVSEGTAHILNARITVKTDYFHDVRKVPHLVIMPYPARYCTPWKLRDGTEVIIRPVRAEDEPLVREMLSTTSEETLRVRYFVAMEITHKMVMQFCNLDYDREIAFVAEMKVDGRKRIIGGGQIIIEPGNRAAQFAALIHDDFHGKGLGEKLLDILIGIAQEKELDEIYGIVLTENEKMLRVCRKMGFTCIQEPDGITRVSQSLK